MLWEVRVRGRPHFGLEVPAIGRLQTCSLGDRELVHTTVTLLYPTSRPCMMSSTQCPCFTLRQVPGVPYDKSLLYPTRALEKADMSARERVGLHRALTKRVGLHRAL